MDHSFIHKLKVPSKGSQPPTQWWVMMGEVRVMFQGDRQYPLKGRSWRVNLAMLSGKITKTQRLMWLRPGFPSD